MKRLKDYLLNMNPNSTIYDEIYDGQMLHWPVPVDVDPEFSHDSTYWHKEIGFKYERPHKLSLDKPIITVSIPIKMLNLSQDDCNHIAAEDYILRAFKPYLDYLNEEITNRKRPAKDTGRYYIYSPGGEVLKRNCVYFKDVERIYYELLGYRKIKGKNYAMLLQFTFRHIMNITRNIRNCPNSA